MGYDFHITRADDWSETAGHEITKTEWEKVIDTDPALVRSPGLGEGCASWRTPSGAEGWLCWSEGELYTKYPDTEMLAKMLEVAGKLDAKILGDDGEEYRTIEDHPDYRRQTGTDRQTPWWKFW